MVLQQKHNAKEERFGRDVWSAVGRGWEDGVTGRFQGDSELVIGWYRWWGMHTAAAKAWASWPTPAAMKLVASSRGGAYGSEFREKQTRWDNDGPAGRVHGEVEEEEEGGEGREVKWKYTLEHVPT